ncbi:hypothetical protein CHLNCDRAFT_144605 [Chlorella variabilis]|uniref:Berberine/berberine-like domain-containing protein n=1 Tax=Chlorella variabilis TaxID=554065 RepID=E1ZBT0_CHLVA|nr:hypothetical protein CHLNCDRAFT_144605 [Chlorella variabilis]EFN56693.1 hypothetical protein CHLNCDRAFT_144605 [Chlorella variabilis]|eukprot:XP_005848795.1 hypothetical protein CHLNCDRAFT_144605 [Chlorella variabilis]
MLTLEQRLNSFVRCAAKHGNLEALAPIRRAAFYNFLDCGIRATKHARGPATTAQLAAIYFGSNARRVLELKRRWDPANRLGMFCG